MFLDVADELNIKKDTSDRSNLSIFILEM